MNGRNAVAATIFRLLPLLLLAHGIRDSGLRCDGPGCYNSVDAVQALSASQELPPSAALLALEAPEEPDGPLDAPPDPGEQSELAKEQDEAAASTVSSVPATVLMKFWLAACGLFALLIAVTLCVFRGRMELSPESSAEKVAPMPDVGSIRTKEAFSETQLLTIQFKDEGLERMWRAYNKTKRLEVGILTLFLLTIAVIAYQLLLLVNTMHIPCLQPTRWDIHAAKLSFFIALLGLLGFSLQKPRPEHKKEHTVGDESGQPEHPAVVWRSECVFWLALTFYFFAIPAINMPPLSLYDCNTLKNCKEYRDEHWFIGQAIRHVDCTLSGSTALQMMITWLLIQPWVTPCHEMIHICWLWIGFVYVGWTVAWSSLADSCPPVYSNWDIFRRTLTLSACTLVSTGACYYLERTERVRFLKDRQRREASKGMFLILEDMVPQHVIGRMMRGEHIADHIDRVSILFVLIADFDQKTKEGPSKVLAYLNEHFSKMDEICTRNRVTKIETVGEEYVAAVGVVQSDIDENKEKGHGAVLRRLLQASGEIMQTQTEDTKFKMGVHTGSIVAGVMQTAKLPRFRLFGNTINTAARMMQKAPVGQLQFGEETRQEVPDDMLSQVSGPREVEMKGKGNVQAYLFTPGSGFTKGGAAIRGNLLQGAVKAVTLASKVVRMRAAVAAISSKSLERMSQPAGTPSSIVDISSSSRLLDAEVDKRFQVAVGDLMDGDEIRTPITAGWEFMSEKKDFTPEMEEEWAQSHHEEGMCKGIPQRFGLGCVLLLFATCYEMTCMYTYKVWQYDHPLYIGRWRGVVFIYCRGMVLFISICWWYIADTRAHWLKEQRKTVHLLFVASYCLSAVLLYMSYDAFVCSNTQAYRNKNLTGKNGERYGLFKAPHDQIHMLNFLLFFFFISQQHAMLFWPSLSFVAVACLISVSDLIINSFNPIVTFNAPISWLGKVMFVAQAILNTLSSYTDEQQSRKRFKQQKAYSSTRERTEVILRTLMPEMVVPEISRNPEVTPSHEFRHATVAQSDLCGFTQLSSTKTPHEVVGFMGELFGMFDDLTDVHGVYKVETVGDAYIAGVAEPPLTKENSPIRVVLFALDMVRDVDTWSKRQGGIGVTCRVGVNYGRCLGGIVGDTMQRYHLFGDLLTVMEILESTAPEGRVQVSSSLKKEIDDQRADGGLDSIEEDIGFEMREDEDLRTSKGEVHTYESVRGKTYIVTSDKALRCLD